MRTLRIIGIIVLIVWILRIPVEINTDFEFLNRTLNELYESFVNFGIPLSVIIILSSYLKKRDSVLRNIALTLSAIVISVGFLYLLVLARFCDDVCSWETTKIISKHNENINVVEREMSCGALDNGHPVPKEFLRTKHWNIIYTYKAVISTHD